MRTGPTFVVLSDELDTESTTLRLRKKLLLFFSTQSLALKMQNVGIVVRTKTLTYASSNYVFNS